MATKTQSSARSKKSDDVAKSDRRYNKIYRTPCTPAPEELLKREQTFVLDCRAVSNISNDYSRANPKHGSVIPPYNAQLDRRTNSYFRGENAKNVDTTLERTGQAYPGTCIEGSEFGRFFSSGAGARYLSRRNQHGCGKSRDEFAGHSDFLSEIRDKPLGYSGRFGYRRNTPSLRNHPSTFGVLTKTPLH